MNHIPIDLVGCNVRITDRFDNDYKLTKGDIITAFFCAPILLTLVFLVVRLWMIKY